MSAAWLACAVAASGLIAGMAAGPPPALAQAPRAYNPFNPVLENRPPVRAPSRGRVRAGPGPAQAKASALKRAAAIAKAAKLAAAKAAAVKPTPAAATAATAAAALATAKPAAAPAAPPAASTPPARRDGPLTMETYLDRLMVAESGGRPEARNPRSTALGHYQFLESTFLAVIERYFASEMADLTPVQILALRADPKFSRRAAEAYTRENASYLAEAGVQPTYPNLRLAHLVGPGGAARILKSPPETPLFGLLGPAVLVANPFMAGLTAQALIDRSARDLAVPASSPEGVAAGPRPPTVKRAGFLIPVRCNLRLPSCRRWVALHQAKARSRAPAGGATREAAKR